MLNIQTNKLSGLNRYLILLVAILMAAVYIVPIWHISLEAPQYPEGLSMSIHISSIKGGTENDLQNINLLNHYIGMEHIVESSIPELLFMPKILAYMIAGAVIAFVINRVFMVSLGIFNLVLVALAGLYDFWRWEYNYGHNLNPEAAIIIPGMSYQPPLLGCKTLLNITACSVPHIGGIILFGVMGILIFIVYNEYKKGKTA